MKVVTLVLAACAFAALHGKSHSQFVKGNEAVLVKPDGTKAVHVAPVPRSVERRKPCAAVANCNAGPWYMVETTIGIRECTEPYARAGTCRESSYGSAKMMRLWVVRTGGTWRQCQYPDLSSKCVDIFAPPPANLPYPAVQ